MSGKLLFHILLFALALIKAGPPAAPFKIAGIDSGPDTKIVGARVELVQDLGRWRETWADHREIVLEGPSVPLLDLPKVDFAKNTVLVLAPGLRQRVEGFQLAGIDEAKDMIKLRFAPVFSTGTVYNSGSSPYAFVLLPRTKKKMEIEVDLRRSPQQDSVWTRIGAYEATLKERGG